MYSRIVSSILSLMSRLRAIVSVVFRVRTSRVSDRVCLVVFGLVGLGLLAGCSDVPRAGTRPAEDLAAVVEAYLQRYQSGPLPRLFQSTVIYDRNGEVLAELFDEGRRQWVSLDQISPHLLEATVATEDATFFANAGIDPFRVVGAAMQNMEEGAIVSGASTITMQLARNLFLGTDDRFDQSVDRKILEAGLARDLTLTYSKREILEMYVNLLNYGHLAYGPQAAARTYFDKPAADLTLAEATLLAGLPQAPARLDPLRNLEGAKQRQRIVLDLMVRHGYLGEQEADAVYETPLTFNPDPGPPPVRAPHFVNYVVDELDRRLGAGYVRRGGLQIRTSLDLTLQNRATQIAAENVARLAPRYGMNNAALVALKPGTAEVLVMVGSINYDDAAIDGQVNVATSPRQPGSAIKPVLYATALNDNLISPATVIWDTPTTYTIEDQPDYDPVNYDDDFHGPVTARSALANSFNVPAVKLLDALGVSRMLESGRAMGLDSLSQEDDWYGLSLTLGGGEVTLLDLASAYHTMANQGQYLSPRSILSIRDAYGNVLVDDDSFGPGRQVVSPAAAFQVTDMLSDNEARVPMFGRNSSLYLDRPAAAKTGTTDDNRDSWTMGYARYLLAGVWTGNTQGQSMRGATGSAAAAPIWNEFMQTVFNDPDLLARIGAPIDAPADGEQWAFQPPSTVEHRDACPPGLTCRPDGGDYYSVSWLIEAGRNGGALADSVVRAPAAPVYAPGGRHIGYCLDGRGTPRELIRLPARFGLPSTITLSEEEDPAGDKQASVAAGLLLSSSDSEAVDLTINERALSDEKLEERRRALPYTGQVNRQVSLGPCDEVTRMVANAVVDYDTQPASQQIAEAQSTPENNADDDSANDDVNDDNDDVDDEQTTEEELAESASTPVPEPTVANNNPARYQLAQPIAHDNSCPGSYVMGRVTDLSGNPVAGVHVRLEDGWNNVYTAVTKSGSVDFGQFDFPLFSTSPQDLRLTVLDSAGNPASQRVIIPHRQSENSDYPCHYVVMRGG